MLPISKKQLPNWYRQSEINLTPDTKPTAVIETTPPTAAPKNNNLEDDTEGFEYQKAVSSYFTTSFYKNVINCQILKKVLPLVHQATWPPVPL